MNIRSQEYTVYLDVSGEDRFSRGSQGKPGYEVITPQSMAIRYEWYPEHGMWRTSTSTMQGFDQRGKPTHYIWTLGQPDKPLWVVVLEHKFHPLRNVPGGRR